MEEKNRAVFLDRDGVLCEDTDYVTSFDKMHIFPFAKEAVGLIHQKGYLAIVVTNQSAVARGMMTEAELWKLNGFLQTETGVDAVYYCPHLPPEHTELPPYRIFCSCRKPGIGMLQKAACDMHIAMEESYMVGDRASDIETGKRAGTKTTLISDRTEERSGADFVYPTVLEFAKVL
ncbi:MAG: D-glycero-alpha-D-manno-heptose-1,7-bisphosphate 7-phosphatase [Roseburia sp.]